MVTVKVHSRPYLKRNPVSSKTERYYDVTLEDKDGNSATISVSGRSIEEFGLGREFESMEIVARQSGNEVKVS